MQITQEKRPGSRIGLSFVIPADQVKRGYDKTLRQICATSDIPGFRKGKAPVSMVIRAVGKEQIKAAALEDLLQTTVQKALKEANISPLGEFELDGGIQGLLANYQPDGELSFSGSVEVMPTVELPEYKGLAVQVQRAEPDLQEVEATLQRYREERATLIPVSDRPAQMGDVAILDFTATFEDGSPVEGSTAHDFQLDLKAGNFYPGFCEGVVGMSIDDMKEIVVTVPEDYFDPNLAGKVLKFRVTLNDLKAKELPELDDQFAQGISAFQTLAELRTFLEEREKRNALKRCQANAHNALLDHLLQQITLEVPESLVQNELVKMVSESLQQLQKSLGVNREELLEAAKDNWQALAERLRPEAVQRIQRGLVLGEIIRREKIEVGQTELDVAVQELVQNYPGQVNPNNVKEVITNLHQELLIQKTLRWLVDQSQITWVDKEGNPVGDPFAVAEATEPLVTPGVVEAEFAESQPAGSEA
ncbi:MAG: trigger factor [Thermostichales cyanobacterium BF4_bins_65]